MIIRSSLLALSLFASILFSRLYFTSNLQLFKPAFPKLTAFPLTNLTTLLQKLTYWLPPPRHLAPSLFNSPPLFSSLTSKLIPNSRLPRVKPNQPFLAPTVLPIILKKSPTTKFPLSANMIPPVMSMVISPYLHPTPPVIKTFILLFKIMPSNSTLISTLPVSIE
jgi:hypothetical protein